MRIHAALTEGQGKDFQMAMLDLAEPQADEVLIKIIATGVCHTDAVARDMALTPYPVLLGHEGAGIVEMVGSAVTDIQAGDHVVLSFASCGVCDNCLTGHPTVCARFNELNMGGKMPDGSTRLYQEGKPVSLFFGQSSFGTYSVVKAHNVVPVPKNVDLALLGPLGCGIQTGSGTVLNTLRPEFGSSIAIFGSGAVGLSAIMAAKICGCESIIAVDIHDNRLELAKELGATHSINSKNTKNFVEEVKEMTGGGLHYAIETTGVSAVLKDAVAALRPLGTVAIVGVTGKVEFDVQSEIMAEGKTLKGVIEGDSVPRVFIPKLIEYYRKGQFPFDKLIRFYNLNEINQAFEDSKTGEVIKPILRMD